MKKYFITGVILLLPLALTLMLFLFLIDISTNPFMDLAKKILVKNLHWITLSKFMIRIFVILSLILCIFLLGFLARWFFFKSLIKLAEKTFSKIPLIKPIYGALKDIADAFFSSEGKKAFRNPVILQFPSKNTYCIGFETGDVPKVCQDKVLEKLIPVFIPTAPHPISGFLILTKESEITNISLTNEDAVKFTVSCGMITPNEKPS